MIKDVSPAIVGVINMQKSTNLDDLLNGKTSKPEEAGIGSESSIKSVMVQHISLPIITLSMVLLRLRFSYTIPNKLKQN